ncbi:hypothetical protein [Streptomyces sp. NPDC047928]|uniref:hypothetical protein n=1 Tax=unclassified Streptomyces TaxID=2593676 RepID=UPI0037116232
MYGQGFVPPQPRTPTHVIVWRVLFAVLPLLSLGLLTWATVLRLAVVTRRALDWVLFGVSVAITIVCAALVPDDIETTRADLAVGGILLNAALFTGYFLYADIRHHDRCGGRPAASPYALTYPGTAGGGYGYPHAQTQPQVHPQTQPQVHPQPRHQPQQPQTHPHTQAQPPSRPHPWPPVLPQPYGNVAQPTPSTPPQPQPQAPGSPRIRQVRAELDELSDLLRKEEGK